VFSNAPLYYELPVLFLPSLSYLWSPFPLLRTPHRPPERFVFRLVTTSSGYVHAFYRNGRQQPLSLVLPATRIPPAGHPSPHPPERVDFASFCHTPGSTVARQIGVGLTYCFVPHVPPERTLIPLEIRSLNRRPNGKAPHFPNELTRRIPAHRPIPQRLLLP